jgi:GT2 family glycosyltransferase
MSYYAWGVIAIVVLTYNRLPLLQRCVHDVLMRTSAATSEIVIWDNASDDGTRAYLSSVDDPRITVIRSDNNVGTNAYARAVALTSAPYIVEVDDDVIDAPNDWDQTMLDAFLKIPKIGYLVADLREDPNDSAYRYLQHVKDKGDVFTSKVVEGVRILEGPTGGGCAMTSREIYDRVGGFRQHKKLVFWHEAGAYVRDLRKHGYRTAYLQDLKVWHAGSPHYSKPSPAKLAFHDHYAKTAARKDLVKTLILRAPFASSLNARYRWFEPPQSYEPPEFGRASE